MKKLFAILLLPALFFMIGCGGEGGDATTGGNDGPSKTEYKDQCIIHALSDPEGLHPTNTSDAGATQIKRSMFQHLLDYDFETAELIPVLAKSLPSVTKTDDGGMIIDYELREEARWDDGSPVTAEDVAFSFKAVKNMKVDASSTRPSINFIIDVKLYPENPRKITFICDELFFLWDHVTGTDVIIAQKKFYDPENLSDQFTFKQIASEDKKVLESDANLAFSKKFNDIKFQREVFSGSGPYSFVSWTPGSQVVIERKDNWWGNNVTDKNDYFQGGPKKLVYETINNYQSALASLKSEKLDVMPSFTPVQWIKDLPKSDKFNKNFNKYSPDLLVYTFLGMHTRDPLLTGKKTRKALAHLVDKKSINKSFMFDLPIPVIGPIHPSFKDDYNDQIKGYDYNVDKAKQLLAEDGWEDANNDGILDKMINGVRQDFKLTYSFNKGNDTRQNVGLALKEATRAVGIEMEVVPVEWAVYLQKLEAHEIQMWYGGWVFDPRPSDPKQIWHTESYNGGSNYTGFGNENTDALIESIRAELDPVKRSALYKKWQEILNEEVAYIFMNTGKSRMGIHKRFDNINLSRRNPGFYPAGFTLGKGFSATAN